MAWARNEIQRAFDDYRGAADAAGLSGDWQPWAERFTPDARYVEHMYGEFNGRQEILDWITPVMTVWPFDHMRYFPWDWYTIDADQGFVVGQIQNRFVDPGDGGIYQGANWTRLLYAGDGLFSEEEDVYNPAHFEPVVRNWLAAWKKHHPN